MILLMDGVKYEERPPTSHDDLEGMVKEHYGEIFREGSLYFDIKHKLRGGSIGAIPDGYCLTFAPDTLWVIEVERSTLGCYDHIVAQLSRFMNGLTEPQAQRELRDALLGGLDQQTKERLRGRVGELHPWLEQLISAPSLLIVTEKATDEIRRASRGPHFQARVLEFATFRREGQEGAGLPVHIHQFEPLALRDGGNGEGTRIVTAGMFQHIGNGIYHLEDDPTKVIDVKESSRIVKDALHRHGLSTQNIGSFYWYLRKKAGLLNTPTEP